MSVIGQDEFWVSEHVKEYLRQRGRAIVVRTGWDTANKMRPQSAAQTA